MNLMATPLQARTVLIDPPGPFDTLERWELHLQKLRSLPANVKLKPQMIAEARRQIARKKAERSKSPA
jgi:hypothetical protein